jgi:RNA polymerase-associated protein
MVVVANKRSSVMTLYSSADCPFSHRTRIVLAEKGITYDVLLVDSGRFPEDLIELNPYSSLPTLVDRGLVLYDSRVINEYLDERFPHPPLLPVDPVSRARSRLLLYRVDRDWYALVAELESRDEIRAASARKAFRDSLLAVAPVFAAKSYFMSEEFSLVDACIAPLLWRLPHFRIELPVSGRPIADYARRVFTRGSFLASLTKREREMRH